MNVTDWQVNPMSSDVIRELYIEIQNPGIKQWLEMAEVNSYRVRGTLEPIVPFDLSDTNRMVAGYFAWGVNKTGGLTKPSFRDGQFINWKRTYIVAPPFTYCFRLWLRRGVVVDVYPKIESPYGISGGVVSAPNTGVIWQADPPP